MSSMLERAIALISLVVPLTCAGLGAEVNLPPRAELMVVNVIPGVPASFELAASDPDGDPLAFTVLGGPHHGQLVGDPPHLTYIPELGSWGTDEITFSVADPYGAIDLGLVKLCVTPPIPTHYIGDANALSKVGLAELAVHLAGQQVQVWYIFTERAGVFAIGEVIPVLLPPGGEVSWVGMCRVEAAGAHLELPATDWDDAGLLHVATRSLPAGAYILTVVKHREAFSFLIALKGTPDEGTHLAAGDPREEQGG